MKLNQRAILSEDIRRVTSSQFEGGRLTAILTTTETDLRGAEVQSPPVVLNVRAFLAEVDITVPEDWQINNTLTAPVTEFKDLRRAHSAADITQDEPDLVITGFGLLAEITLRD